ncbi:MAG: D-alanine--D-alanine ligase [Gemmatimonadetes bacterium]|nr:D-alanine--D-alanine ligase [Gemmatimonadota bacterium]
MRLGLAYNQRPTAISTRREAALSPPATLTTEQFVEWDEPETIAAVADALRAFGDVVLLEAIGDFPRRLAEARVDLMFNMAEGRAGPSREAQVPAIAEFLGVPYTASDPLTLAIALHKGRTKEILRQRGLPTPPFLLVESFADLSRLDGVEYPLFLKPVWEGSSKGIGGANRVESSRAAKARAEHLLATYRQPVLAEWYLPGDEFTVAVLGNDGDARCLPLIRYRFETLPHGALPIMGFEAKWVWDTPEASLEVLECPADIAPELLERIQATALAAYRAIGCRDWARLDVRLDAQGVPNVLEINPLPGIIPDPAANSCFPLAAAAAGLSYAEMIHTVVRIAWRRVAGRELAVPTLAGVAG